MKNCKVLVTGGAGFIGLHLVEELLRRGAKVAVLDLKAHDLPTEILSRVDLYIGDVRNASTCRTAATDCKYIFHLAAKISVPESVLKPHSYHNTNVNGTFNILRAAEKNGVERVVFSSSAAVYGDSPELPKRENLSLTPKSPYAFSKMIGEQYCSMYSSLYNLSTASAKILQRLSTRQNANSAYASVVPSFLYCIERNKTPQIHGEGDQTRDFCHVSNIVNANILAATAKTQLKGEALNIGCGTGISIKALYETCCKVSKKSIPPTYTAAREGDIKHSIADISLAKSLIGYDPLIDFEEGMKRTI